VVVLGAHVAVLAARSKEVSSGDLPGPLFSPPKDPSKKARLTNLRSALDVERVEDSGSLVVDEPLPEAVEPQAGLFG